MPLTVKSGPTVLLLGGQQIVISGATGGSGEPLLADDDLNGVSGMVTESIRALVCWIMTGSLVKTVFSSWKGTV